MPFPNKATQFKKGVPPNPKGINGYAKMKAITEELRDQLAEKKSAAVEAIVRAWIQKAKKGSFPHLKEMLDRTEGKVKDVLETNGQVIYIREADGHPSETSPKPEEDSG